MTTNFCVSGIYYTLRYIIIFAYKLTNFKEVARLGLITQLSIPIKQLSTKHCNNFKLHLRFLL